MGSKIYKIIWLVGIYSILGIILYLTIEYKVVWEHKDLNTYLYFYNCNDNLCTSPTVQKQYYNKIICEKDVCPFITNIIDNNVILSNTKQSWIYNYVNGEIVNNNYQNYQLIEDNNFIVTNEEGKQGIIDLSNNIVVDIIYDQIYNYTNNILVYKENNTYKIKNNDNIYELPSDLSDIIIIDESIFAAKKNNQYNIYSYYNLDTPYDNNTYDYIYSYKDILLTISNKKIDILTTDLESTLIMKINTFYEYKIEKERASLKINIDDEYMYFNVFINESEYTTYKYNINENKLV